MSKMPLSIVTTLFHSEPYIEEFVRRAIAAAEEHFETFELVIVDDGSPDKAASISRRLADIDSRISVITLSRNFGHHPAMLTGLSHAKGDLVFMIDSDLEEDPAWLTLMLDQMNRTDADLVMGIQVSRKGNWFERLSGKLFYWLYEQAARSSYPADQTTARLMKREFVDALAEFPERETCFSSLCELAGFQQDTITVTKLATSETTYTLRHKLRLFADTLTASSTAPLKWIFVAGASISALSIFVLFYVMLNWAMSSTVPSGWTSLMASIWFLGGAIMASLGIVGHYVSMALLETKRRPRSVVKSIYNSRTGVTPPKDENS